MGGGGRRPLGPGETPGEGEDLGGGEEGPTEGRETALV